MEAAAAAVVADATNEPENMLEAAAAQAAATSAEAATTAAQAGIVAGAANGKLGFIYDEKATETVFGKPGEDGRPANVPVKYWDADKKAVKGDVVFNQLKWAEGKLGAKLEVIGGPADGQEYRVIGPEGSDYEFDKEDPAVRGFLEIAKKHDVSQSFVSEVIAAVGKELDDRHALVFKEEIAKLGDKGMERLKTVGDYLAANLEPEQAQALQSMMTRSEHFLAFEALLKKSAPPNFLPRDEAGGPSRGADVRMSPAQWNEMNYAVNEQGVRLRSIDPAYNKKVEDLRDEVFGNTRRDANGREVNERGAPV